MPESRDGFYLIYSSYALHGGSEERRLKGVAEALPDAVKRRDDLELNLVAHNAEGLGYEIKIGFLPSDRKVGFGDALWFIDEVIVHRAADFRPATEFQRQSRIERINAMKHFIRHPQKGWLGYDEENKHISWFEHHWYATQLKVDELALVLMALGRDRDLVAIIPWNKEAPSWYSRAEYVSINLWPNQHDWIKERIQPLWDGNGNCSWFIDHDNRSYGPISAHPLGGFSLPYDRSGDRYESVFMAAAAMMQDKVELFKKVVKV